MRLTRFLAVAAVVATVAGAAQAPSGVDVRDVRGAANFISACGFSHRNTDDPIVYPRRPGRSHNHTYVGNVSTNAFSTLKWLRAAGTTCDRKADTAAYWAPTLLVEGEPLPPTGATIYYRRYTAAPVRPFPPGLKMVAGNSHATSRQSRSVTYWSCGVTKLNFYAVEAAPEKEIGGVAASSGVPRCLSASHLELYVNFPDCWNGKMLDSPDHHSHMAYSVRGACPRTHPVAVPAISLIYHYPRTGAATVVLSSGGGYSGHADFINAWKQNVLTKLVDSCLNELRACAHGS